MLKWIVNEPKSSYLSSSDFCSSTCSLENITVNVFSGKISTNLNCKGAFEAEFIMENKENHRSPYAKTLPTLEIEYSPSTLEYTKSCANLRDFGVADVYFQKPRYISQNTNDPNGKVLIQVPLTRKCLSFEALRAQPKSGEANKSSNEYEIEFCNDLEKAEAKDSKRKPLEQGQCETNTISNLKLMR